jgi:phosphoglycolate phosphatase
MIKLVAFDWNGTLLSDVQAAVNSDNFALKKLGFSPVTVRKFRECFDMPIINYWTNLGMPKSFFKSHFYEIEKLFHDHYEPLADKCRTGIGARDLLKWLKKNNIEAIIYSNHTVPNIGRLLKRLKIEQYISKVIARELGDNSHMHNRGKEQKLFEYVKSKKLKPSQVISIGDTEEEIEIGKAQGYHTVAITGGYNSTTRLKKHKPQFLVNSLVQVEAAIKQLNG